MKTDIYMGAPWWREELALTNHDVQVVEDGDLAVSMRDNGWDVGYRVHPIIGIRYLEAPDLPIITEKDLWQFNLHSTIEDAMTEHRKFMVGWLRHRSQMEDRANQTSPGWQTKLAEEVKRAEEIALKVHGNQLDKIDMPYMDHVSAVRLRTILMGGGRLEHLVAILHDTIEDAKPKKFRKRIRNEIKETFGPYVYDAVIAISKKPNENYFKTYLPRVIENPVALFVKFADVMVNSKRNFHSMFSIRDKPGKKVLRKELERLRKKYRKATEILSDGYHAHYSKSQS